MAGRYDIKTVQGDTLKRVFEMTDSNGNAVDFTGFRAIFQVRATPTDVDPLISLTSDDGGGLRFVDPTQPTWPTDPTKGCVLVTVTRTQAEVAASRRNCLYQLKLIDPLDPDNDFTLSYGEYIIEPEVAK